MWQALRTAFHRPESRSYQVVNLVVWLLIVVSLVVFAVDVGAGAEKEVLFVDDLILSLFAIEISLRVLTFRPPLLDFLEMSAPRRMKAHLVGRLRYCLEPLNLVDIITVLAVIPALRGLRALRLLRLLRTAKVFKYANPIQGLVRAFVENRLLYIAAFTFLLIVMLVGGLSIFLVEVGHPESRITTIREGMWWSLVTITTVGYGDLTPQTGLGQLVASAVMVGGMFTLALFAGIVGHTLLNAVLSIREEQFRMSGYVNHIVICGYDAGAAMLLDAVSEEIDTQAVQVVVFAGGERPSAVPPEFAWVSGDPTKESELDKIRLTHASTVLIVGSREVIPQHADANTILTAFTVRRYMKRHPVVSKRKKPLYIVAEILDEENVEHARTAGADEVIETTRMGFALMAHAIRQPGTAEVVSAVAIPSDVNVYVGALPPIFDNPEPYGQVRRLLRQRTGALVIGLRIDGKEKLNPDDDFHVPVECDVIYLASGAVLGSGVGQR